MFRNLEYTCKDERGFSPLALLALIVLAFWLSAGGSHHQTAPFGSGLDSIGTTVSDMDNSVEFNTGVLSFDVVSEPEASLRFYRDTLVFHLAGASEICGEEGVNARTTNGASL